jgi:hypothetical protein
MPRNPKATEPETKPVEATPELSRGAKAQVIRDALKANPGKEPKEIVALQSG